MGAGDVWVEGQSNPGRLHAWVVPSLLMLGLIGALWLWAGVVPAGSDARTVTPGPQHTAMRDDGNAWQVTEFQPGRRAEIHLEIRRRGPIPIRVLSAPAIDTGPPRETYCGWWPDELKLGDGQVVDREASYSLPRGEPTAFVLSGQFLGEPGCLDEGRIGARRSIGLAISVAGAPKRVRVDLPVVLSWSTSPEASARSLAERSVAPRVGTAP